MEKNNPNWSKVWNSLKKIGKVGKSREEARNVGKSENSGEKGCKVGKGAPKW